jgi:hypothetical protein
MEHAERIEVVLTKLKNALAESEALKKRILERKRDTLDSDAESSVESQASDTESTSTPDGSEADTEVVEKPVQKSWCCCFRKQKLN